MRQKPGLKVVGGAETDVDHGRKRIWCLAQSNFSTLNDVVEHIVSFYETMDGEAIEYIYQPE